MRIVGSTRPIVFRGAHNSTDKQSPPVELQDARPEVGWSPLMASLRCSEGDTLLPGAAPALVIPAPEAESDLIGELRRAVAEADASCATR